MAPFLSMDNSVHQKENDMMHLKTNRKHPHVFHMDETLWQLEDAAVWEAFLTRHFKN